MARWAAVRVAMAGGWVSLAMAVAACSASGGGDTTRVPDSGVLPTPEAGTTMDAGGIRCGAQTCGEDKVCCESCGMCALSIVECGGITGCEAVDAGTDAGDGDAGIDPDAAVDGGCITCNPPFEHCSFEGTTCEDCGELVCSCGGADDLPCPPATFCEREQACGASDDQTGVCVPGPQECPGAVDTVCGCNLRNFNNECIARAAGQEVLFDGFCPQCDFGFQVLELGSCRTVLGWDWRDSSCVELRGCGCTGSDCGRLPSTKRQCELLFRNCP